MMTVHNISKPQRHERYALHVPGQADVNILTNWMTECKIWRKSSVTWEISYCHVIIQCPGICCNEAVRPFYSMPHYLDCINSRVIRLTLWVDLTACTGSCDLTAHVGGTKWGFCFQCSTDEQWCNQLRRNWHRRCSSLLGIWWHCTYGNAIIKLYLTVWKSRLLFQLQWDLFQSRHWLYFQPIMYLTKAQKSFLTIADGM